MRQQIVQYFMHAANSEQEITLQQFWKIHQNKLPNLYRLAAILFSIPISSAKAEGNFSTLSHLRKYERNRLHRTTTQKSIYIHDNFKHIAKQSRN